MKKLIEHLHEEDRKSFQAWADANVVCSHLLCWLSCFGALLDFYSDSPSRAPLLSHFGFLAISFSI